MSRKVVEIENIDQLSFLPAEPVRLVLRGPLRGGAPLGSVRARLLARGDARFSGTSGHLFADFVPGQYERLIALDMLARNDPAGLERAILSALPHVDYIVVGVDGRSDAETRKVAEAYADHVWTFGAAELGLSDEAWAADRIDFAAARNIGRSFVQAAQVPWILVLDTDEYLQHVGIDLRARVRDPRGHDGFSPVVLLPEAEHRDQHRLARAELRWIGATHNQLPVRSSVDIDVSIVHDPSVRAQDEQTRRIVQRRTEVGRMRDEAEKGNLHALWHLSKQLLADGDEDGLRLAEEFRLRAEIFGALAEERQWLACGAAAFYYNRDEFEKAGMWSCRALLDGPCIEAFCILGDCAEVRGDLEQALTWYELACITPRGREVMIAGLQALRWGRRSGLRLALGRAASEKEATNGEKRPAADHEPGGDVGAEAGA